MRIPHAITVVSLLLIFPAQVFAHPIITEVMWMGSDLSTSDEWLEIANLDATEVDVSGWTITSLNSSAKEIVALRFATGTILQPGAALILATKTAANSRLSAEPFAVSSTLTLPNTKLLLRLRDSQGSVIDEVDDGVGAPFAGDNPSGSGSKASMERTDLFGAGTVKEHWKSADVSEGFDPDSRVLGTPGFISLPVEEPPPDDPPSPPVEPPPDDPPPDEAACSDPLEIAIAVQSGPLVAVGKATVNFQAVATAGSMTGVACSWVYGDGFTSQSCNPPSHSFTVPGTYAVRVEAKNQCDTTLVQEQIVVVQPDPSSGSASSQSSYYDGSKLVLAGALPNPEGTDTGKEWIEIRNLEEKPVDLRGWKISVGETSYQWYSLKDSIGPRQVLRLYSSELKFTLPNTASRLRLVTPSSLELSSIPWSSADEGMVYLADDLKALRVSGRVVQVTGPVTFQMELQADAASILGENSVTVRVLGVDPLDIDDIPSGNGSPYEYFRALMNNKNVELEFDTNLWDQEGRLLAYVYTENIFVQNQLMVSKMYIYDGALDYKKKSAFKDFSKTVWKDGVPQAAFGGSAVVPAPITVIEVKEDFSTIELKISEIYSSPFSHPKDGTVGDWKNEEWLEIENRNQKDIDLTGWILQAGKKKKALPSGLRLLSNSFLVLKMSSIKLSLKNAGDTVRLLRPDNSVSSEMVYPELKNGLSFSVTQDGGTCMTIHPTPGETNDCVAPPTKKQKAAARKATAKKTAAAKAVAKTKKFAKEYEEQLQISPANKEPIIILRSPKPAPSLTSKMSGFASGFYKSLKAKGSAWWGMSK
jgi:endonuclease YncB( thermonuclease family)